LNRVIFRATPAVSGPRSLSYTTLSWLTRKVMTPELPRIHLVMLFIDLLLLTRKP